MKALVIGPAIVDFDQGYNVGIKRALQELGFETELLEFYVSTPPGLFNRLTIDGGMLLKRDLFYRRYVERFNREVLECYARFRPDFVFVIRGSKLKPSTVQAMKGPLRVLWCQDAVQRSELEPDQMRFYERIYVFEGNDVAWLRQHFGLESTFLPMGFDPLRYFPMGQRTKDIDVFFVGKYYAERRELLERLSDDFPDKKLCFYGRHVRYREPHTWAKYAHYALTKRGQVFVNRSLNPTDVNRMYSRSKICLNIHHEQSSQGCNPRVFEIMGAGAFQLVDNVPYVQSLFGDTVASYRGYDDLRQKIEFYLKHDDKRDEMAARGHAAALAGHSLKERVRRILDECGLQVRAA